MRRSYHALMTSFKLITAAFAVAVLAGCSAAAPQTPSGQPAANTPPVPPASPSKPTAPRVTDLMAKAGCAGQIIGTQLYATETGRCTLAGTEVTISTFASSQQRDEWVKAAQAFGGSYVAGDGWAARLETASGADELAAALGGARV